jgi:hypothetical protein
MVEFYLKIFKESNMKIFNGAILDIIANYSLQTSCLINFFLPKSNFFVVQRKVVQHFFSWHPKGDIISPSLESVAFVKSKKILIMVFSSPNRKIKAFRSRR